jgi:putative iron-regulated protein
VNFKKCRHLALVALMCGLSVGGVWAQAVTPQQVVSHHAQLVHATYTDALLAAKAMQAAIEGLVKSPSTETLNKARDTWRAAREF